jgi:xanthine dehydrogenase accessory factor
MIHLLDDMKSLAERGEVFALATVIDRSGSAPRSTGAKMLVRQDGGIAGTVGGGILEANVQALAAQVIRERRALVEGFQFSGRDAASMDAICGGQVEVLVEWVDPNDGQTEEVITSLRDALHGHRKAWLVTVFNPQSAATTHALVRGDGGITGSLPAGISLEDIRETRLPRQTNPGSLSVIIEPLNISGSALIFGAGHVSRSLAEFTKAVGFRTVIIDDRPEYASRERFPGADEIIVLENFEDLLEKVKIDGESYAVIVTRGHLNDQSVLEQLLRSQAAYIGMIGSRRKCELIFEDMRRKGYTDADIQRVHAPIGIPIQAETPEEIGVSIVAEMIRERAAALQSQPRS